MSSRLLSTCYSCASISDCKVQATSSTCVVDTSDRCLLKAWPHKLILTLGQGVKCEQVQISLQTYTYQLFRASHKNLCVNIYHFHDYIGGRGGRGALGCLFKSKGHVYVCWGLENNSFHQWKHLDSISFNNKILFDLWLLSPFKFWIWMCEERFGN